MTRKLLVRAGAGLVELSDALPHVAGFVVPGTSLGDVTGLTASLAAGKSYAFRAWLLVTQTVATGMVGVGVNFTGTASAIGYGATLYRTAAAFTHGVATAANVAIVDSANRNAAFAGVTEIEGRIVVTVAGTLAVRAQRSAGTTTVTAGFLDVREL